MPPPVRRECMLMSALVNPVDGNYARTTDLMAAMMSSPKICCHLLTFLKLEMGILSLLFWRHRYATCQRMAATRHSWGWLVRPCLINSPLTPLLWVVNRRLTKSA